MDRISLGALVVALTWIVGCNGGEQITSYTVTRTEPQQGVDYQVVAQQLDHTLAAILPQGRRAWFFKLAGPAPVIDRHRQDFLDFLKSVAPAPADDAPPTWQLPTGWQEKEPTSEFITTVLTIPDESDQIDLTVSSLELSGEWKDFVANNVNRWLGQLDQGPLPPEKIARLTRQLQTPAGGATVIELVGVNSGAQRPNPHAQSPVPAATSQPQGPLTYETPKNWQPGQVSAMRTAAFNVVDGEKKGEVTVIALPTTAGSQVTDVAANVQRWAGQVGSASEGVLETVEKLKIGGSDGNYIALLGPESAKQSTGILAAMVEHGDKVWFFKFTGDRALVESQQDVFRKFLGSVRFQ